MIIVHVQFLGITEYNVHVISYFTAVLPEIKQMNIPSSEFASLFSLWNMFRDQVSSLGTL